MKCVLEVVATPTIDTPGTLLALHFDDKRYLIGNLAEGSQRACLQHGLGLKKVDEILLTGPTRWESMGGMLGMILGMADVKKASEGSKQENEKVKQEARMGRAANGSHNGSTTSSRKDAAADGLPSLMFHGAPNLNYAIATARRFIFRTGMPLIATEHTPSASDVNEAVAPSIPPTWSDDKLHFWAMPLQPKSVVVSAGSGSPTRSRKRSFHEINDQGDADETEEPLPKRIVKQMFDSNWSVDDFVSMPLKDVKLPATVFIRDSFSGQKIQYTGPLPGGEEPVPNLTVLVRKPWPAVQTNFLPPSEPSPVSVSYIIRNHPQRGKFQPDKAKALGVPKGPKYGLLSNGHTVQNNAGRLITPEEVLAPGKQGGGFAVIEIPSSDYVQSLIDRPEWGSEEVLDGIEAMIWILGRGVIEDVRVRQFQDKFGSLRHIVSSPDLSSDRMALESAVKTAMWNHRADNDIFPKLLSDPAHLRDDATTLTSAHTNIIGASRGLQLILEPRLELSTKTCVPILDLTEANQTTETGLTSLVESKPELASDDHAQDASWPSEPSLRDVEIMTLGTGSSHPSTQRNVSATLVRVPGCGSYLLDCGEGTLGTLRRMYSKHELDEILGDLRMVWISHMHADHHLGLTSVIRAWYEAVHQSKPSPMESNKATLADNQRRLAVVSDAPMLHWLQEYSNVEDFGYSRILPLATKPTQNATTPQRRTSTMLRLAARIGLSFDQALDFVPQYLDYMNLSELSTVWVHHCRGAQGISFQSKSGLRVSYSGDCRPSADFAAIGLNSHVLIHEATFEDDMRNEAFAKRHSTAGEALVVGSGMKAQSVILTHFSQRYPKMPPLGVTSQQSREPSPRRELERLLEKKDNNDDNPAADDPPDDALSTETPQVQSPRQRGRRGQSKYNDMSGEYSTMIDAGSIAKLIQDSGMRVVMAFDYMRLKLGDLPRLERKQPLLRAMYEMLAAKEDNTVDSEQAEDAEGGRAKKRVKPDKAMPKKKPSGTLPLVGAASL